MDVLGISYEGAKVNGRMEGNGSFVFADGLSYQGGFQDGMFHGRGTLTFPDGSWYEGEWNMGREVSGKFFFRDGLEYGDFPNESVPLDVSKWEYCIGKDRRFHTEVLDKIRPAGETQLTDKVTHELEEGQFDIGDGILDMTQGGGVVKSYSGEVLRKPSTEEIDWARKTCREGRPWTGEEGQENE